MQSENDAAICHAAPTIAGARHFAHEAMATVFELYVEEEDAVYARQAAQAAFAEVDRLERELSRFVENSDISRLNGAKVNQAVSVGLDTYECLAHSKRIHDETGGAFDITIGALYACWLDERKVQRHPSTEELARACQKTGMQHLRLDPESHAAEVLIEGLQLDLGGIGKGFAADKVAEVLREWHLNRALVVAGASSVLALDPPTTRSGWPLTFSHPTPPHSILARFHLAGEAVSASGQRQGRHIIDPRPGKAKPVEGKLAAWSLAPTAVSADALSTAFMVMEPDEIKGYCLAHPETGAVIIQISGKEGSQGGGVMSVGRWPEAKL
jgi:thiamine biosynthesis lipoprotein